MSKERLIKYIITYFQIYAIRVLLSNRASVMTDDQNNLNFAFKKKSNSELDFLI